MILNNDVYLLSYYKMNLIADCSLEDHGNKYLIKLLWTNIWGVIWIIVIRYN